jgi:hypothetical protein
MRDAKMQDMLKGFSMGGARRLSGGWLRAMKY